MEATRTAVWSKAPLADRYEALRTSAASRGEGGWERDLLMNRGVADWMRAVVVWQPETDELARRTQAGGAAVSMPTALVPDALRTQATTLLASMVWANDAEVRA